MGSAIGGKLGQVVVGSTADRLLHSCPVPLAVSPRGYRRPKSGALSRITCTYPGTPEGLGVVQQVAALDATDWMDGEVLAIGTSPSSAAARVFLGSRGSKILRYSPVPVLVLPG